MKILNESKITFLSKSANEGYARAVVAAFAAQLDPTLDELGDIKTSVSEAVTNCIVHAYPDSVGIIHINLRILEGNILEIAVRDRGIGIPDINMAMTPMYTTGGSDRSGMGLTIIESFNDNLKIRSKPDSGTTIIMRKRISMRNRGSLRDRNI